MGKWSLAGERGRLDKGPRIEEEIPGLGTVRFIVSCPNGAERVQALAKTVLEVVSGVEAKDWETTDWRTLLPQEFVQACADEMNASEAEAWLQRWQSLTASEQQYEESIRIWSLSNWLYWLAPMERSWCWWDSTELDETHLAVAIAVKNWPFPWGSFAWLFRGCGAASVEPEQE